MNKLVNYIGDPERCFKHTKLQKIMDRRVKLEILQ